jgi:hypothetical protein
MIEYKRLFTVKVYLILMNKSSDTVRAIEMANSLVLTLSPLQMLTLRISIRKYRRKIILDFRRFSAQLQANQQSIVIL